MSQKIVLKLDNVTKSIKKNKILENISFDVREAEIVGFVGKNGAGKTTTIKTILGLLSLDSGEIKLDGLDIEKDREKAMVKIGGFVDTPSFYKHMTAYQNLALNIGLYSNVDKKRINEVLDIVGLSDAKDKKVGTFSYGMNQRLGLARTIIHRPSILVLDEPVNGLDPRGIIDIRNYLLNAKQEKVSVLISSHNLAEIQKIVDRIVWIDNGRVVGISNIDDVSDIEEDFLKLIND